MPADTPDTPDRSPRAGWIGRWAGAGWSGFYFSSFYMSVTAAAFVFVAARWLGRTLEPRWYCGAAVGCAWVYLVDAGLFRVPAEDFVNAPRRAAFMARSRWPLLIGAGAATAGVMMRVLSMPMHRATWMLLGALTVIAGLYVMPIIPRRDGPAKRLKDFATVKPIVISIAWLAGAMGLAVTEGVTRHDEVVHEWLIGALLMTLLLADSIALDWADRPGDAGADVHTLATRLTPRGYDRLMLACIALQIALTLIGLALGGGPLWLLPALIMIATHGWSLYLTRSPRRDRVLVGSAIAAWRIAGAMAVWLMW
ncbi:MAG: hypothetical protein GC162_03650 [Planctomycetes bacterium]|nr:hypothetical protein [Planctomycetota bacterium]